VASARLPALYLNGSRTRSITADGVTVFGNVFLRAAFTAEGEVRLLGAQIGGDLDCSGGVFRNPPQKDVPESGKALNADGINVRGNVFLRRGFTSEGEVRLLGAQIGGDLDCHGGHFKNPPKGNLPESGKALYADGVNVRGGVILREGFTAEGEVRFLSAQIGAVLDCSGGKFKNVPEKERPGSGDALNADRANVRSGVFLRAGFTAEGEVSLLRAQIGADLDCSGGVFKNPPQKDVPESGKALTADRVNVEGGVFLREDFAAHGEARLLGAHISGNLDCSGGKFKNPPQKELPESSGRALSGDGVDVRGSVFLRQGFTAEGRVLLLGARIGRDLDCRGGPFSVLSAEDARIAHRLVMRDVRNAELSVSDLRNAVVEVLIDDEASWPAAGNLHLDGFVYGRISAGPTDAETRLKWLALQPESTPQPYRQLAKVLREMGDDRGARKVLYEMECRRRAQEDKTWYSRLWGRVLWATIGYGLYSRRALGWLVSLTLLGTLLFGLGYLGGSMAPTEREAYACFEKQGWPPRHYQQFNPLVYSLENSVPLLRLGQDSVWAPNPGPREQEYHGAVNFAPFKWLGRWSGKYLPAWHTAPWLLRCYRWLQIVSGWMLATLFVAGVTGVVRRE
jgi:hypothetical protein